MKTMLRTYIQFSFLLLLIKECFATKPEKSLLEEKLREYLKKTEVKRRLQPRIIGGSNAPRNAYPWYTIPFTYDMIDDEFYVGGCGASLVAPDMLLTASHCMPVFVDALTSGGGVIIGQLCLLDGNNCNQDYEIHYIDKIFPHPEYHMNEQFGHLLHDVAIVKLEEPSFIDPVPLDQGTVSPSYSKGKKLWTLGFGDTDETVNVNTPTRLMHVDVEYVPNKKCDKMYDFVTIDNTMICAGSPGKDSCQGDSGGPLYDWENDSLEGIVSWGLGCAVETHPGVYANVATEWPWIEETICRNYGQNSEPDFCESFDLSKKKCSQGEKSVSVKIETNEYGSDSEWGIYNHDMEKLIVRQGKEYWSNSIYNSNTCIDEDVCHTLYLEGEFFTDSTFEITFDGKVASGSFRANVLNSLLLAGTNCTEEISSHPFSGAFREETHYPVYILLGIGTTLFYML